VPGLKAPPTQNPATSREERACSTSLRCQWPPVQEEIESLEDLSRFQPIWVDLESPTLEEKRWIKQHYGLSIPEDAMDEDIEESARFYEEDNGELHIRSDFLIDDDEPRTCAWPSS
jgi:Mg2+ and Co2+ transporter CorA